MSSQRRILASPTEPRPTGPKTPEANRRSTAHNKRRGLICCRCGTSRVPPSKSKMAKHQSMPDDFGARLALAFRTLCDETRTLDLLGRYESRFTREYNRSVDLLEGLRAEPREPK